MENKHIYAIIISYNGGSEVSATARSICGQVDKVVVVDNGSDEPTLTVLKGLEAAGIIELVCLGENRGIAHAQNVGIEVAHQQGAEWVLTLDQDSFCTGRMVERLLAAATKSTEKLGFCCPVIKYETSVDEMAQEQGVEHVDYAISSGCLFPMATLQTVGQQVDEYFIDSVDFEYCLRLAVNGYRMLRVKDAILRHKLGVRKKVDFLGRSFFVSVHAPFRRYYVVRNHIFLVREYWRRKPAFLVKKTIFLFLLFLQILFLEDRKMENIRQCGRGVIDGIMGHGGKNMVNVHS
ncbi:MULTISPECIES: glycosyltransferase family 2 protein [Cupriavidus]